ncbi:hypothetical protein [Microbacterium paraoxydans]|uniref:hypothetical protein n=1 Tax=Microbacterium paraoxydans TaxID=199592 RepID=UPI0011A53097|nr:hypothetical protein [Microbacterium paraoxydans]MCT2222777.1 hypothetical protein [Microbacterium paraoxydans]
MLIPTIHVAAIRLIVVSAVPESTRGRALAAMGSVTQTAGYAGTALAAPLVVAVGPAGALAVAGIGTLLAATLTLLTYSTRQAQGNHRRVDVRRR